MADPLLIAKCDHDVVLLPGMANRHGLIAGATGTGKTVTLQVVAESLSRIVCLSSWPTQPARMEKRAEWTRVSRAARSG